MTAYWIVVDFEVVVHEGIIREKPTTKEEARQFLKGFSSTQYLSPNGLMLLFIIWIINLLQVIPVVMCQLLGL